MKYSAIVVSVHDGDTLRTNTHLGFGIWFHSQDIRLFGINAPELTSSDPAIKAKAIAARDVLSGLVLNKAITLDSANDAQEKYGRYLGTIYVAQPDGTLLNVNDYIVTNGYAVPYPTHARIE